VSIRTWCLLAVVTLSGCAGDECDVDADCLSNACTFGTCESALVNKAFEKEPGPAPEPEPEPECIQVADCDWLTREECAANNACQSNFLCMGDVPCDSWLDDCPLGCALRTEDECTGECSLLFTSCAPVRQCAGLSEQTCKSTPGCAFE
jgi:hypothetical protein